MIMQLVYKMTTSSSSIPVCVPCRQQLCSSFRRINFFSPLTDRYVSGPHRGASEPGVVLFHFVFYFSVVRACFAAVANNLEAADDLANGEEAETFGGHDTTSDELSIADVAGLLGKALRGREKGAVLEGLPQVLVHVLECGDGTALCGLAISSMRSVSHEGLSGINSRRAHLLAVKDNLGHLGADLGVVDDEGSLACSAAAAAESAVWVFHLLSVCRPQQTTV